MHDIPSLTLSVLLVAHAEQHSLQRCVRSIAEERMNAVELILIDDASPQPIVLDLKSIRCPVTVLRNTRRRGLATSRNTAAAQALGDVLVFLAPNVTLAPGSLGVVERAFLADPLLGVVVGETMGMAVRGGAAPLQAFEAGLIAVRSSVFREAGGFVERPATSGALGTLEFVMRLAHAGVRMVLRPNAAVTPQQPETLAHTAAIAYRHGLAWMRLSPERRGLSGLLAWSGIRDAAWRVPATAPRPRWQSSIEQGLSAIAFSAGAANAWLRGPHREDSQRWSPIVKAAPHNTRELRYVWRPTRTFPSRNSSK